MTHRPLTHLNDAHWLFSYLCWIWLVATAITSLASAETLSSEVFSTEALLAFAQQQAPSSIDVSPYAIKDPEFDDNQKRIRANDLNRVEMPDPYTTYYKSLTVFDDGDYGVDVAIVDSILHKETQATFLYTAAGNPSAVYLSDQAHKAIRYRYALQTAHGFVKGDLMSISIQQKGGPLLTYTPKGQLLSRWVNNQCFSADNSPCGRSHADDNLADETVMRGAQVLGSYQSLYNMKP